MALSLAVLWPDTHRPYHHVKANHLILNVIADLAPKELVLLGDFADFYSISKHKKDPRISILLEEEVDSINQGLNEIDLAAPNAKKTYIEGNHENRLERFIASECPQLFGITECQTLFGLDERPNWKWISYGPGQKHRILDTDLMARHEPLGSSAKSSLAKSMGSLVYGHIHRIEEFNGVSISDQEFTQFSVGWLGDKRKDLIFGYTKGHQQWQLGFGLVWADDNKVFHKQTIQIQPNISCVINGKEYRP